MENTSDIPELKLAKVGAKRRRRGGGLPLFGGSGTAGGGVGAGAAGTLASKIGISLLAAALGAGAYGLGKALRPETPIPAKRPRTFASAAAEKQKYEGDLSRLPGPQTRRADSLGMVSGSMDGLTPEERAARAASAKAEADKQAKEAAEAAKKGQEAPPGIDANALAAAAAGAEAGKDNKKEKGGPFNSRFGNLSASLGGGLAGGSGLAGGVGQSFGAPKLGEHLGLGRAGAFQQASKPARAAAQPSHAATHGQGLARRQLNRAAGFSQAARVGTAESRTTSARAAFEDNAGERSAITGGGLGMGAGKGGTTEAPPSENPAGGGPTMGGDSGSGSGSGAPPAGPPDTKAKWEPWIKAAAIATLTATALLVYAEFIMSVNWHVGGIALAQLLGKIVMYLGILITAIGLVILGMGQTWQGSLFTAMGGLFIWAGHMVAVHPGTANLTHAKTNYWILTLGTSVSGAFMGGMGASGASHHWDA